MKYIVLLSFITAHLFAISSDALEKKLKYYLEKKFTSYYSSMTIKKINISPNQKIPEDCEIVRVYLPNNSIKRESGSFSAIIKTTKRQRRIYFKYNIDAKVSVLKATTDIKRHSPLSSALFEQVTIKFSNFYDKPILKLFGLEAKNHIPQGKILIKRLIRGIPLIHKKDKMTAIINSGGIELNFPVTALEDGSIGEHIRVRRDTNKIFQAIIISQSQVQIR